MREGGGGRPMRGPCRDLSPGSRHETPGRRSSRGIAGEHNRLTVHSRLIHIVPRCPPVITSLSDIRLVRSCLLDGITRGARGTAARWRRRPLPSSHLTGCPREVTSSRPGRRTEPAARATGATTVFPRGTWWTVWGNFGLLSGVAEVGGDDRVELRAHPRRVG